MFGRWLSGLAFMVFALARVAAPAHADQFTADWSGTADWASTANWSLSPSTPPGFAYPNNDTPGVDDTYFANIGAGSATLNSGAVSIDALSLSGGNLTINSPASLSLVSTTTNSSWSSGTLSGSGSLNIGSGVTMTLDTGSWKDLRMIVDNNGATNAMAGSTWAIVGNTGGAWNNNVGSVFDLEGDTNMSVLFTNNSGAVFKKSGGTRMSNVIAAFNNSGDVLINAASGGLSFRGGGIYGGTTTVTNTAATVEFTVGPVGYSFQDLATNQINVFGAGTFNLRSGTHSVAAGNTLTIGDPMGFTPGRMMLSSQATLQGAGDIQVNKLSTFTWFGGGSFSNLGDNTGGSTTIASGASFNIAGEAFLGETVNNNGSAKITNVGSLFGSAGAIWNNNAGAVFDLQDDSHLRNDRLGGGTGVFNNNNGAKFVMSGPASSTVEWSFNNSGTVHVESGGLFFTNTLTNAGTIVVDLSTYLFVPVIESTGTIMGNGIVTGKINGGSISPGESAGELTVRGDLNSDSNSTFSFEIGGIAQANSDLAAAGIGLATTIS